MTETCSTYSPAETVEMTGFSLDTLRYYEKIGLLQPVRRAAGGHRRYTEGDVSWLDMVRCLRGTGMPIARMLVFAEQVRGGPETIPDRIKLLEEHDAAVQEEMTRLAEQREKILGKIAYYRSVAAAES